MDSEKSKNGFDLYKRLTDQSSEIECLFIERAKQLLKDGGLAGIILPSSILSNSGIYTQTRAIILKYFEILAIAEMGSNTFMATGTNTVTLFLRRRNNADAPNIEEAIKKCFINLQDVTINGIENPISKYIVHVWEGISYNDYKTLLQKKPNEKIKENEIYREYKKKIKAKNDDEFWASVLALEQEKLLYFIIAHPQKLVLVKTGNKNEEKRFLGYEFSNRRGSEGIHPIRRGKHLDGTDITIDDCTRLYDANTYSNLEKASTYIYKAFNNEFDLELPQSLEQNISYQNLTDLLTFDRVVFEKKISLSAKKKLKIESKWQIVRIKEICEIGRGRVINKKEIESNFGEYPVYSSQTSNEGIFGYLNTYDFEGDYATWTTDGIYAGSVFYRNGKFNCTNVCGTLKAKSDKLNMRFLAYTLPNYTDDYVVKVANPKLMNNVVAEIQIPLPPKDIQNKIVLEIEALEKQEQKAVEEIEKLRTEIGKAIGRSKEILTKLEEITSKIGSGATPRGGKGAYQESGISLIRSQNVYDYGFVEKGLAYINEEQAKKLDNVTVEKNDILFNITGASIARCCIVPDKYLPARVNQHVSIIRTNSKALPKYVQIILVSDEYKSKLLQIGDGGTSRQAITKLQLEEFKIPLPPITAQKKIVSEIENIEKQIAELQKQINTVPKQKEAILKKYLE